MSKCPARSSRAAPLPPDERRAAIIEAVIPLLSEYGDRTTSRQIAQAARVSEGTIFKVFTSKEDLFTAVIERAIDPENFEAAMREVDRSADFHTQLVETTSLVQRRIVEVWHLVSKVTHRPNRKGHLPDSPALIALLQEHQDQLRMPAPEAARLLRGLALSLTHPMLVSSPATAEHIVDFFLNGVGA